MDTRIPEELEDFVREQLESGHYRSLDDLVCEGLRALREREELFAANARSIREQVREGVEAEERGELADGPDAMARIRTKLERSGEG